MYRDDRPALLARIAHLERELARATRQPTHRERTAARASIVVVVCLGLSVVLSLWPLPLSSVLWPPCALLALGLRWALHG